MSAARCLSVVFVGAAALLAGCPPVFEPLPPLAPLTDPSLGVSALRFPVSRDAVFSTGTRPDGGVCVVVALAAGYDALLDEVRPVEVRVVDVGVDGVARALPPPPLSRREGGFFAITTTTAIPVVGGGCAVVDRDAGEIASFNGSAWTLRTVSSLPLGEAVALTDRDEVVVTTGDRALLLSPGGREQELLRVDTNGITIGTIDDDGVVLWIAPGGAQQALRVGFDGVVQTTWTLPIEGLVHHTLAGTTREPFAMVDITPVQLLDTGDVILGNDLTDELLGEGGPPQLAGVPVRSLVTTFGTRRGLGVATLDGVAAGAPLLPALPRERPCACDRATDPRCACLDGVTGLQAVFPAPDASSAIHLGTRADRATVDVFVRRLTLPAVATDLIDASFNCGCDDSAPHCVPVDDVWQCLAEVPPTPVVPPAVPGPAIVEVVDLLTPPGLQADCVAVRVDDGLEVPCVRELARLELTLPTRFDGRVAFDVFAFLPGTAHVLVERIAVLPRERRQLEAGLSLALGERLGALAAFAAAPVVVGGRLLTVVDTGVLLTDGTTTVPVEDTAGCGLTEVLRETPDRALVACPSGFVLVDTRAGRVLYREAGVQNWHRAVVAGDRIAIGLSTLDAFVITVDGDVLGPRSTANGPFALSADGALLQLVRGDLIRFDVETGETRVLNAMPLPPRAFVRPLADGRVVLADPGVTGSEACDFSCAVSLLAADGTSLTDLGTARFVVVGETATNVALISGETVSIVDAAGTVSSTRLIAPVEQVVQRGDVALLGGILVSHLDLRTGVTSIPRDGERAFGGTPQPFDDDGRSVIVPPATPPSPDLRLIDADGVVTPFIGARNGPVFAGQVLLPPLRQPAAAGTFSLHPAFTAGDGRTRLVPCLLFTHRPRASEAGQELRCARVDELR